MGGLGVSTATQHVKVFRLGDRPLFPWPAPLHPMGGMITQSFASYPKEVRLLCINYSLGRYVVGKGWG